jgi:hypothetical protein
MDPEVINQYEQQAKALRIAEGEKLVQQEVKMIPAKQN